MLQEILPDMGMVSVFDNSANLTKLSVDQGLKVSEVSINFHHTVTFSCSIFGRLFSSFKKNPQVLHKAVIEVDETGTTAAAATTIGITPFSLPRTFTVNRPFFFFIYHEDTYCLLFMGRVTDPTKN